jgi:hypothetical protein
MNIDELIKKYGHIRDTKFAFNHETEELDIPVDYTKVWDATIQMLEDLYTHNCHLPARLQPRIYVGPNGSIDVDWEKDNEGLLVNVDNSGEYATFYGSKMSNLKFAYSYEGRFKLPEHCEFLHIPSE